MTDTSRCPISYQPLAPGESAYSHRGLHILDPKLEHLEALAFTPAELRTEAQARIDKLSIAGVQPKVSAWLNAAAGRFELTDRSGRFILKPPVVEWPEVPENEDLTMRLAAAAGIETPDHGLVYMKDGSLCYAIRRFDRLTRDRKVPTEDFAQLMGLDRETKYDSSMERVAGVIDEFCSFPVVEKEKLFRRVVVAFLLGNEDMHVKNFSLITDGNIVRLSPAYDFVNSTIVLASPRDQLALPLGGKKSSLQRRDFVEYYAKDRLKLTSEAVDYVLELIAQAVPAWSGLIDASFLSDEMRARYLELVNERVGLMGLGG